MGFVTMEQDAAEVRAPTTRGGFVPLAEDEKSEEPVGLIERGRRSLKQVGSELVEGARGVAQAYRAMRMVNEAEGAKYGRGLAERATPELAAKMQATAAERQAGAARYASDIAASEAASTFKPRPVIEEMSQAKTLGDAWTAFTKDPAGAIVGITAQSAPAMAPALVVGLMNPTAGAAAMGLTSGMTEFGSTLLEEAQTAGVDPKDPAALQAFFSDPVNLKQAVEKAGVRAGIIGGVDTLTGGLAGRTMAPAGLKSRVAKQAVNIPAQMGVQAAAGAGAEAGAQVATEGAITQPGAVFMEAIGEFGGAPAEALAFGREAAGVARAAGKKAKVDLTQLEAVTDEAGNTTFRTPSGQQITKEQWDNAGRRMREAWLTQADTKTEQGVPRETAAPQQEVEEIEAAPPPKSDRVRELERLAAEAETPEARKALESRAKAAAEQEEREFRKLTEADDLMRLAGKTKDETIAAELRARALKLRGSDQKVEERPSKRGLNVREETLEEIEATPVREPPEAEINKRAAQVAEEERPETLLGPSKVVETRAEPERMAMRRSESPILKALQRLGGMRESEMSDMGIEKKLGTKRKEQFFTKKGKRVTRIVDERDDFKVGKLSLFRKDGRLGMDDAAEWLQQNGYLEEQSDHERAREIIRKELADPGSMKPIAQAEADMIAKAERQREEAALEAILEEARALGIETEGRDLAEVERALVAALDADWTTKTGLPAEAIETASIVRRAAEIDEQAVHDAAVRFGDDEAAFIRAAQEIIDGHEKRNAAQGRTRAEPKAGAAAGRAATGDAKPAPAAAGAGREAAVRGEQRVRAGEAGERPQAKQERSRSERGEAAGDLVSNVRSFQEAARAREFYKNMEAIERKELRDTIAEVSKRATEFTGEERARIVDAMQAMMRDDVDPFDYIEVLDEILQAADDRIARPAANDAKHAEKARVVASPDLRHERQVPADVVAKMRDARSAARWLVQNSKDPAVRRIARRIMSGLTPDMTVAVHDSIETAPEPIAQRFGRATAVTMWTQRGNVEIHLKRGAVSEDTLVHELLHAATIVGVHTNEKLRGEIESILGAVRQSLLERGSDNARFFDKVVVNADELLAYGLTSPTFRSYLQHMTPDGKWIAKPKPQQPTMWQRFVRAIVDFLGIPVRQVEQAIERAPTLHQALDAYLQRAMVANAQAITKAKPKVAAYAAITKEAPESPEERRRMAERTEQNAFAEDIRRNVNAMLEADRAMARQHKWKYGIGDILMSKKTGKAWEIVDRSFSGQGQKTRMPHRASYVVRHNGGEEEGITTTIWVEQNIDPANYTVIRRDTSDKAAKRPYESAPAGLMGFNRLGPQKEFGEQRYKKRIFVRVKWSGGDSILDGMDGLNTAHAMERAHRNWPDAESIEEVSREQALKEDPDLVRTMEETPQRMSRGGVTQEDLEAAGADAKKMADHKDAVDAKIREFLGERAFSWMEQHGLLRPTWSWEDDSPLARDPDARGYAGQRDGKARVVLYYDRIEDVSRVPALLVHEIGTHFGLQRMLGEAAFANVLSGVRDAHERGDRAFVSAWNRVKRDYIEQMARPPFAEGSPAFLEEVSAAVVESAPADSFVRRLISQVRAWVHQNISPKLAGKMDESLLKGLAIAALRKTGRGELDMNASPSSPDEAAARLMMARGNQPPPPKSVATTHASVAAKWLDYFNRHFIDSFSQLKKRQLATVKGALADQLNAYAREQLMHGRVTERLKDLGFDYLSPIIKIAGDAGLTREDVSDGLYAMHAPEANRYIASINPLMPDGGSGMTNAVARSILDSFTPEQRQSLDKIMALVQKMNRAKLDRMVSEGLITDKQRAELLGRFKNWLSLKQMDDEETFGLGDSGLSVRGKEFQARMGRYSKAEDPLSMTVRDAMYAVMRVEKNRVARSFHDFVKANPSPELWELVTPQNQPTQRIRDESGMVKTVPDPLALWREPQYFGVKIDGEQKWVRVKDKLLAEQLKKLGDHGLESDNELVHAVVRAVNASTRLLSRLYTQLSPDFALVNPVRDVQQGLLVATALDPKKGNELARRMFANLPSAVRESARANFAESFGRRPVSTPLYEQFRHDGGTTGGFGLEDAQSIQASMERVLAAMNGDKKARALVAAENFLKPLMAINDTFENTTRFAIYKAAIEAGFTREQAAVMAKNVTVNFNKRGQASPVLNALYAFFNASVQANAAAARAVMKSRTVQVASALLFAAGAAAALADEEDERGIDESERVSEFVQDRNLVIPFGENKAVKVPLAYGFNIPYAAGRHLVRTLQGKESAAHMAGAILKLGFTTFLPTDSPVPTVAQPIADVVTGRDFADRQIAKENPFDNVTPKSSQYRDNANAAAVAFFKALNQATGGTEFTRGAIDISPEKATYLVKQYLGGLATPLEAASLPFAEKSTVADVPVVRRFMAQAKEDIYVTKAARIIREAEARRKEIEGGADAKPGEEEYVQTVRVYESSLRRLAATRARLLRDDKRADVSEIDAQRNLLADQVLTARRAFQQEAVR